MEHAWPYILLAQTAAPVGGGRAWPGFEMTRRSPAAWRAPVEPHGLLGLAAAPVGGGKAWPYFETTRRSPAVWRVPYGLLSLAAAPVGGSKAWPGFEIDHSDPLLPGGRRWNRMDYWAWPRRPWAAAKPGHASR